MNINKDFTIIEYIFCIILFPFIAIGTLLSILLEMGVCKVDNWLRGE